MPGIRVVFTKVTSPRYARAVELCRQAGHYQEYGTGREFRHDGTFGESREQKILAARLIVIVAEWQSAEILIHAIPVSPHVFRHLRDCIGCAIAAFAEDPQRYCQAEHNASYVRWAGLPPFPCRRFYRSFNQVDWTLENHRLDQMRALLAEEGILWCPFLDLRRFEVKLAACTPKVASGTTGNGLSFDFGQTPPSEL